MGWAIILVLALTTAAGLYPFVRRDIGAMQFLGAALFLALAGYAWQQHADMAGHPKAPPARGSVPESEFAKTREDMLGRFDRADSWLTMAEGFQRRGDTQSGAEIIRSGIRANPNDPDLWVGLGNALVLHNDGLMSPAAQLAFQRAARIAPNHPAPRYFFGLALAQGGNFDEAERIWRELIAAAPPEAEYRRMIEERLAQLQQQRAMQTPVPAGQGAPPPQVAPRTPPRP
jgi:cytochrome c-type biogenesis protein CcmH